MVSPSHFIRMCDSKGTAKNTPKNGVHSLCLTPADTRPEVWMAREPEGKVVGWAGTATALAGQTSHRPGLQD